MVDVFVVGAGPSGLLMAAELIRHGLRCRIIDKSSHPSDKSQALAIQARTLEILNYIGITDECIEQGLKISHVIPTSQGKKLCDISLEHAETPYPFVLSLEQSKFERILIEKLQKMGCHVERKLELLDFQQSAESVHLSLKNKGKEEVCKAKWLIGCDGAHSTVRHRLGLSFEGGSFPQIFSLMDLDMQWKYPRDRAVGFLEKTGILFCIPIKDKNRCRLVFQTDRSLAFLKTHKIIDHGEISSSVLPKPTLEEAKQIIHQYADRNAILKNLVWSSNFSINSRMVGRYQKGRVFLVGDASHIHSPVGGQGMNTGLQDAFNLAWKLAFVHKGILKEALIESYNEERYYVGKKLLQATEKATHFLLARSVFAVLRNKLLSFITSFSAFRKAFVAAVSEINICYPSSRWIVQTRGGDVKRKAGKRAPDVLILSDGSKTSLFSVLQASTSFHLLFIDLKEQFNDRDAIAKKIESKYGSWIEVQIILQDPSGNIQKTYGDLTLYLIRPDGYISYCGPLSNIKAFERYLSKF